MAFTKRSDVGRALTYAEMDGNFAEMENVHDEALEARDIAVSGADIYPDTATGVGATAEGGYFTVPDTGTDELVIYRVETGAAVEKVRFGYRLPFDGGTLTQALNHAPSVSLASSTTVNIGAAAANAITITGTTTITAFDSIADGAIRVLTFADALTLTHNATSLILPGGADITTADGDVAVMLSLGSGSWRCIAFQRADGTAVVSSAAALNVPLALTVTGDITVATLPGVFVPSLAPGQTAKLVEARHIIGSGTSATVKLQRNGVDITGFAGMSVTTTAGLTDPDDVTLAAGDYIQPVVTAVLGAPKDLGITVVLEFG